MSTQVVFSPDIHRKINIETQQFVVVVCFQSIYPHHLLVSSVKSTSVLQEEFKENTISLFDSFIG